MAGLLTGDLAHHGTGEGGSFSFSQDKEEGVIQWYLSRKEIEENSPSRKDGIDLKKEAYLRKSYCTFLQDLGMRLKVPQVTIATAIIFCHRFFLHQSHAKNDRRTIATVCMFLAGKVEETPRPLKDVILVSYEIIHKKDPAAVQRIKQKEVYEQQKELILLGERVVLTTLSFDFNVHHPYKPLVEAIKRLKVAQNSLAQVAWNFVNDGLRTSLCLQFKPHHIAAGAIFLAAKFLKVKLPSEGEKVWWKEFDVTSRQLEEVSNQMLELYEQNRMPASQGSENAGGRTSLPPEKTVTAKEGFVPAKSLSQVDVVSTTKSGSLNLSSQPGSDQMGISKEGGSQRNSQNRSSNYGSTKSSNDILDHSVDGEIKEYKRPEQHQVSHTSDKLGEASSRSKFGSEQHKKDDENKSAIIASEEHKSGTASSKFGSQGLDNKVPLGLSPEDCIKKISKEKYKAAREKRQKKLLEAPKKMLDDDDLIERELEDGVELAVEDKKAERESMPNGLDHPSIPDFVNTSYKTERKKIGNGTYLEMGENSKGLHADNAEDGEVSMINDADAIHSPKSRGHKRKAESPDGHQDYIPGYRADKSGYVERDHKRHVQEGQV